MDKRQNKRQDKRQNQRDGDEEELISTGRERKKQKAERKKRAADKRSESRAGGRGDGGSADGRSGGRNAKNAVRVDFGEAEQPYNRYYAAVAGRYRFARYACIILLVAFLLSMLIFYRDSITYSNLMYLIRDLDSDTPVTVGVYADITYDGMYSPSFGMFRGRVAVASKNGLTLYSASGSTELEDSSSFSKPRLDTGDKYALVYDTDGTGYCLYTTVTRVFSGKTDEKIEDGCVSRDGHYALMTRSEDAKLAVTVYDSDFRSLTKYYKDKYVLDIALEAEGREIAIVSADASASGISCEVMLGKVGTEESTVITLDGLMPVSAGYADDGTLLLLCDGALVGISDGKTAWQKELSGAAPVCFDMSGNRFALCCAKNAVGSENEVFVFDTAGNILYNNTLMRKVSYFITDGADTVYAVGDGSAEKITLSDSKSETAQIGQRVIGVLCPPGNLIICTSEGTTSYFTGE